jgi:hypothetical protein
MNTTNKIPVIVLNGPPGSGKDVIAKALKVGFGYTHVEMKKRLHELAIVMSGVSKYQWHKRYKDRTLKETPWDKLPLAYLLTGDIPVTGELKFMTQRQYLIYISEVVMKPAFGQDYFGKAALEHMNAGVEAAWGSLKHKKGFVFSDGGFEVEINTIRQDKKFKIFLIHLFREGCDFSKDSRSYINPPGITPHKVYNMTDPALSDHENIKVTARHIAGLLN